MTIKRGNEMEQDPSNDSGESVGDGDEGASGDVLQAAKYDLARLRSVRMVSNCWIRIRTPSFSFAKLTPTSMQALLNPRHVPLLLSRPDNPIDESSGASNDTASNDFISIAGKTFSCSSLVRGVTAKDSNPTQALRRESWPPVRSPPPRITPAMVPIS